MISVAEMHELEKRAIASGIDEESMMENAGSNAVRITDRECSLKGKTVLIFCGTGNNAGDGLVFARHAAALAARVLVYFVRGLSALKPLPLKNYDTLKNLKISGGKIEFVEHIDAGMKADIIVDAMLGIGIRGNVDDVYRNAISLFNSMKGLKVSLDCPSGIDCDTGRALGISVSPDMTVTFHDIKKGLNRKNSGRIIVADIGVPKTHAASYH